MVVSQYIGRHKRAENEAEAQADLENARASARQLVYAVTLLSLGMTAVALFLRRPIINLFYGSITPQPRYPP